MQHLAPNIYAPSEPFSFRHSVPHHGETTTLSPTYNQYILSKLPIRYKCIFSDCDHDRIRNYGDYSLFLRQTSKRQQVSENRITDKKQPEGGCAALASDHNHRWCWHSHLSQLNIKENRIARGRLQHLRRPFGHSRWSYDLVGGREVHNGHD